MSDSNDIPVGVGLDPRSSLAKPTGPRRFRPDFKWSLFSVAALVVLVGLGSWQLGRYFEASEEETFYRAQHDKAAPVTTLADFTGEDRLEALKWRRVKLTGRVDPSAVELITARYKFGQLGYGVLAPLKLEDGSGRVTVYLGWVPKGRLKEYLGSLDPKTPITVEGRIDPVTGPNNIADAEPASTHEGLRVWRDVIPATLATFHEGLEPQLVVFAGDEATGKTIDPEKMPQDGYPPKPRLPPSKHVEYFMTWYGAAFALLCVWFALSYRREYIHPDERQRNHDEGQDGAAS